MNRRPTMGGLAAHVSNPIAAQLAREINRGGDAGQLVREALVDAQIHNDWQRVIAIENSLERVDDRTTARHLGAIGTRAVLVNRSDGGMFARRIPQGYEHGLVWLVCLLFLRMDSDLDTAQSIAERFREKALEAGGFGVDWGNASMCLPPFAFGGPIRITFTQAMGREDYAEVARVLGFVDSGIAAQVQASSEGGPHPLAHIVWGTVVTGANDPLSELFDESTWCPALDRSTVGPELTRLLAQAATEFEGETLVHPECMSAPEAADFARQMANEQLISHVIESDLKPVLGETLDGASVRISKIEPRSLPYMDQLLISIWSRANILVHSLRLPRTGQSLEEYAQQIASFCRSQGVSEVRMQDLAAPIGANEYPGYVVALDGTMVPTSEAGKGDAASLIRSIGWADFIIGDEQRSALSLPSVLFLDKLGVLAVLGEHFQPAVWARIKAGLEAPGEPLEVFKEEFRRSWEGTPEDLVWALDKREALLLPERSHALAAQFKVGGGAIFKVTPALIGLLTNTEIGDECPTEFLAGGYDMMYQFLDVPAHASAAEDGGPMGAVLDGVMVQRWEKAGQGHLLLDAFVRQGAHSVEMPNIEVATLHLLVHQDSTLADLRGQVPPDQGLLAQALDLFAGVMLYMNLRDARVVRRDDRAKAQAAFAALNRKKRRQQDYERLHSSYDAIHIGPEALTEGDEAPALPHGQAGVRPHYRRGHFRFNQRFGKGRSQTRPVFIPPVLVNAHKLAAEPPSKKGYVVGPARA